MPEQAVSDLAIRRTVLQAVPEGGEAVQASAAIARVPDRPPGPAAMGEGFTAMRCDVAFLPTSGAPIRPRFLRLSFTRDIANRVCAFRRGVFPIAPEELPVIAGAMAGEVA